MNDMPLRYVRRRILNKETGTIEIPPLRWICLGYTLNEAGYREYLLLDPESGGNVRIHTGDVEPV